MSNLFVPLNNLSVKARRTRVRPDQLLLLLPSCLQWSQCKETVRSDPFSCKRCGRCPMGQLVTLAEEKGVRIFVATGGHKALGMARSKDIRAIVGVACQKELRQGIMASFPKAVLGVLNAWPNGACTDTDVDVDRVRRAVEWFLR